MHFPFFSVPRSVIFASLLLLYVSCTAPGCVRSLVQHTPTLPDKDVTRRGQLVVHSDFELPNNHRLLDELVARRNDIENLLGFRSSDESIHVYLFRKKKDYERYLDENYPEFPDRRAFFVKTDTQLKVYAFWGDRVGEDLRHEVTHGYLHSSVPGVPLWLDEGIAEFFETPRGEAGFNQAHVYTLANAYRRGDWKPDLKALEALPASAPMDQPQYAEAWLWFHFLVQDDYGTRKLLRDYVENLRKDGQALPLSEDISEIIPDPNARLVEHLRSLAEMM